MIGALFQVNLDPSHEPGDLRDNTATAVGTSHATSATTQERNFQWFCLLQKLRASTRHHGMLEIIMDLEFF